MCSAKSLQSMSNLTQTVVTSTTICGLPKFIIIEDMMKFLTFNYLGKIERCQSSEGEGETLTKTTPCSAHCRGTCNVLSSVEILQNMNSHIIVQLPHHVTSPFHHEFTAFFHLHLSSGAPGRSRLVILSFLRLE
jgi:hypothetical protein